MLLKPTEVDIQFMQMLKKGTERCAFSHLCKGIDVFREALATITELSIRSWNIGVHIIDVTGEKDTRMYFSPIGTHLLTIFTAGVEVCNLVGSEDVVHVLSEFGLKRGHNRKLLAHEDLGEEFVCSSEDHSLFLEVLNMRALG